MYAPTHTDTTYIAPVVVTTKTYELHLTTHHYDDGTTLTGLSGQECPVLPGRE